MASTVKSFTMKIGTDTSDFLKGMKAVDKELRATEKDAKLFKKGSSIRMG